MCSSDLISEYLYLTVNGTNYSHTAPADTIYQYNNPQLPSSYQMIYAFGRNTGNPGGGTSTSSYTMIQYDTTGLSAGSTQTLAQFNTGYINDSINPQTPPVLVHITEYGPVNSGYIAGYFTSAPFIGLTPTIYNISASFRVKKIGRAHV